MLIVGLTGGIACGKSTVSKRLSDLGMPIVDMDLISRQVVEPGKPGLDAVVHAFGADYLTPEGTLNRTKLGRWIFADPAERKKLDTLLWPFMSAEIDAQVKRCCDLGSHFCVIDSALLIETGLYRGCDRIIVVDCDQETQIDRLMARNNLSRIEALQRINAQIDPQTRRNQATWIIDNRGPLRNLDHEINQVVHGLRQALNKVEP